MNKAFSVMIFTLGVAVGAAITWEYSKKKFEQLAREEIDSVKQVYAQKSEGNVPNNVKETAELAKEKPGVMEYYVNKIQKEGYMDYSETGKKEDTAKPKPAPGPYIIPPDSFGELDGYEQISFTYYADGVLADENDEIVENVDEIIGREALNGFGEYEDDSVFVRNDKLKADYEILADQRKYSEVAKSLPNRF